MKIWNKLEKKAKLAKLKIPLKRHYSKDIKKFDKDEIDFLFNQSIDWIDLKAKQAK